MAIFRNVQMSFWTDVKVADDFTPDDRLMYLYLLTNPHTNLAGCYEVSTKQISIETGFDTKKVKKLLERFDKDLNVIKYSEATREILILKWHKYNWTKSNDFRKSLKSQIDDVKEEEFRQYLHGLYDGAETVPTPSLDGGGTTVTDTDTVTNTDTVSNNNINNNIESYGEYNNVKLTIDEYDRLKKKYGNDLLLAAIKYLDEYIQDKGYKNKSATHCLTIQRWVVDAVKEHKPRARTDWDALMADIERREAAAT